MRALSICLAFGILSFSAISQGGVFEDKTNRFNGVRSVGWNTIPNEAESFAVTTDAYYSKGSTKPDGYFVQIITFADAMQYSGCSHVDWLVDGEPAPYLVAKYSSDYTGSAAIERFNLELDRASLEKLGAAKLVEFKICTTESSISADDMEGLRKVLAQTK
ncbi:hypothetical protein [Pseudomonas sp. GM67]|uniref:hypothetical protein n=1 Tax=Pseudomonas sp. GM67 TaxID=1144335 RepID=UPI000270C36F|nr:hypothetical protein [Pseudomonas sp. GM67]EJM92445.1 hypothetical protein PMI33_00702 [Pseudomonas sp. GM67]